MSLNSDFTSSNVSYSFICIEYLNSISNPISKNVTLEQPKNLFFPFFNNILLIFLIKILIIEIMQLVYYFPEQKCFFKLTIVFGWVNQNNWQNQSKFMNQKILLGQSKIWLSVK